jgi:2'-5' RNA ligase
MSGQVRLIVITVPPDEVAQRIDEVRMRICRIGASSAALAYPPHVTLRTGALVPAEDLSEFTGEFRRVAEGWQPFTIATDGFIRTEYGDGVRKYLVGYRVRKNEALSALNRRLLDCSVFRASGRLEFLPHLTLAFEDLDREGFLRVDRHLEDHLGEFPQEFHWKCDNVTLCHKVNGLWTPYAVFHAGAGGIHGKNGLSKPKLNNSRCH